MKTLSIAEKKRLRGIGHALDPVVMIGNDGLSQGVIDEALRALHDHELIKVKILGEDREVRAQLTDALVQETQATLVQKIGKIVLIYRKNPKANPKLSNLVRFSHLAN